MRHDESLTRRQDSVAYAGLFLPRDGISPAGEHPRSTQQSHDPLIKKFSGYSFVPHPKWLPLLPLMILLSSAPYCAGALG